MKKNILLIGILSLALGAASIFIHNTIRKYSLNEPVKIYPVKPYVDDEINSKEDESNDSANISKQVKNTQNESSSNNSLISNSEDDSKQTNAQITSSTFYTFPSVKPIRAKASESKYSVIVNISKQKVEIFKDSTLIKIMECSTGITDGNYDTPLGNFKINSNYGESFYNSKYEEGARYWVGFIGATYLFHSLPVDSKGHIIEGEAKKLGTPASHGCIRLIPNDAFWFYENIPAGTNVSITK